MNIPTESGIPLVYSPKITQADISKGYINRYFCRKRNNNSTPIIEIQENQFKMLKPNSDILDANLYKGIQIKWIIVGKSQDEMHGSMIKTLSVYHANELTVKKARIEFPGIQLILKNYLEFAHVIK
jgi:hypothetical protein